MDFNNHIITPNTTGSVHLTVGPTAAATARPPAADGPRSRGAGDPTPAIRAAQPSSRHATPRLAARDRRRAGDPPPRNPGLPAVATAPVFWESNHHLPPEH